jgi:hypothetical protein
MHQVIHATIHTIIRKFIHETIQMMIHKIIQKVIHTAVPTGERITKVITTIAMATEMRRSVIWILFMANKRFQEPEATILKVN